jgi:hypothetical protein
MVPADMLGLLCSRSRSNSKTVPSNMLSPRVTRTPQCCEAGIVLFDFRVIFSKSSTDNRSRGRSSSSLPRMSVERDSDRSSSRVTMYTPLSRSSSGLSTRSTGFVASLKKSEIYEQMLSVSQCGYQSRRFRIDPSFSDSPSRLLAIFWILKT